MAAINKTAKKMMDLVTKNLTEHNWKFKTRDFGDGECAVDTEISSQNGIFKFYEIRMLFREWDMRTIYYLPVKAPEPVRVAACEYLMRANWRTRYGKFTMDFEDGEIRYETVFSPYAVKADVEDVLTDSLDMMHNTVERYASGLMTVIFGGRTPAEAIEEATKPKNEPGEGENPPAPPPAAAGTEGGTEAEASGGVQVKRRRGRKAAAAPEPEKAPEPAPPAPPADDAKGAAAYSLDGLNIEGKIPLEQVVAAVKKFRANDRAAVDAPRLNILLSGAPGSGKTAFARYLAGEVGAPLRTVRASQIMSKYVGETEKKLAEAFEEAKENGEILFIDECDSFLQTREGADHGWEVTQVNELLQQMEEFDGVLIAATNFADRLDKAVMRRFTYKLKLAYLTNDGKKIFFGRYFDTPLTEAETARLDAIAKLTPGDFRTVREELYYLDDRQSNDARLAALEAESEAKGRDASTIGF